MRAPVLPEYPAHSDLVVITIEQPVTPKSPPGHELPDKVLAAKRPAALPEIPAAEALSLSAASGDKPAAPRVLQAIASASPATPPPVVEKVVAAPSADLLAAYRLRLWQAIFARRPPGITGEGRVDVSFRIDHRGNLISAEVAHSIGNILLDKQALRAVRKAAPFPPPPSGIEAKDLTFTIPVRFGQTSAN